MPNRSAKLAPAIVWLIVALAGFQTSPTSFLGFTQQRAISLSEVPCRFFKVADSHATESDTIEVKTPAREVSDTMEAKASAREVSSAKKRNERPESNGLISAGKKKSPSPKKKPLLPKKKYSSSTKKSPSPFSVDDLATLLGSALEQTVSKDDFLFKDQNWGTIHRSTLTLPMLDNLEFQGAAHSSGGARETAMLLAACHVKQKLIPFAGDNDHPKSKLVKLVTYALGMLLKKEDIVYTSQSLGGATECTLTLPILKETELQEFKAKAEKKTDAEKAAALVAIQELEASLTSTGDARKAKKEQHDALNK